MDYVTLQAQQKNTIAKCALRHAVHRITDVFLTFSVSCLFLYTHKNNFIYYHVLSVACLLPIPTHLTNARHDVDD